MVRLRDAEARRGRTRYRRGLDPAERGRAALSAPGRAESRLDWHVALPQHRLRRPRPGPPAHLLDAATFKLR